MPGRLSKGWVQKQRLPFERRHGNVKHLKDIKAVSILFVLNDEDIEGWPKQAFKTKDSGATWRNFTKLTPDLQNVLQFALRLPKSNESD